MRQNRLIPLQKVITCMRKDPSWEEYLSTGEDPTGGLLEEADNETAYTPKAPKLAPKGNGGPNPIFVLCVIILAIGLVCDGVNKSNAKKKAEKEKARQEYLLQQEKDRRWEMDHEYEAYKEREAQTKREIYEQFKEDVRQRSEAINEAKKQQQARAGTPYSRGYHDGYECGYDDGDCNESYGYSFLDEGIFSRYGEEYRRGFLAGYREGFSAGREDYDYDAGF